MSQSSLMCILWSKHNTVEPLNNGHSGRSILFGGINVWTVNGGGQAVCPL